VIRKRGKAAWEYECRPCGHTSMHVDQFRAIEASQKHARNFALAHLGGAFATAIQPAAEAFRRLAQAFGLDGADNQSSYALTPGEQILDASCGPTARGAWVCIPQQCNREHGMCPERLVWQLERES
jgi:hypothetical protein